MSIFMFISKQGRRDLDESTVFMGMKSRHKEEATYSIERQKKDAVTYILVDSRK